ncbi:RNAse (barnase) inhibitor barstar [Chryseobacterium defluvii]|uniref:RNAse (Barnase) inhibitor barstar n=1 Tax=Chryseobacterium defluvii TaxID=160396 RepID=A0A840KA90_9FLAO|nr:barstar family protein [Chryseobacterium defluvii]MBB4806126.1 RNAse (barnase) inhibitor barstar [Chryseobacterium defluvii]
MFAFAIDTLHEPQIIAYIENVKNLESIKTNLGYRELRLINVDNIQSLKSAIEKATKKYENNGFIYMLDENKSILTGTFVSNIKVIKSSKTNIHLSGNVWHHPKGYHKSWELKINNQMSEKNIWKDLRKDELQGWLVYALHTMKITSAKENIKIQIDGNDFHNLDEFFCTIGEEVNGIGGYFGRNLYALHDCMRGDFGIKSISELTWQNHERSKKLFKARFNKILKIFEEYKTDVILK